MPHQTDRHVEKNDEIVDQGLLCYLSGNTFATLDT